MALVEIWTLTEGDDLFPGSGQDAGGPDSILGLGGADRIDAGSGSNTVLGGAGDDTIFASSQERSFVNAHNLFDGGDGADLISDLRAVDSRDTLYGGAGDDRIETGGFLGSAIYTTRADAGSALVDAGEGNDTVAVQLLHFTLEGGAGSDLLDLQLSLLTGDVVFDASAAAVLATLDGAAMGGVTGFERFSLRSGAGDDTLRGGAEADTLAAEAGNDLMAGGAGDDLFYRGAGNDTILCGTGNDTLNAIATDPQAADRVLVRMGAGNDMATVQHGAATLLGGSGDDLLSLTVDPAAGVVSEAHGGRGSDRLEVTAMASGAGSSVAMTQDAAGIHLFVDGAEVLQADGIEHCFLMTGADTVSLIGGAGEDTLSVSRGAVRIAAGKGDDLVLLQAQNGDAVTSFDLYGGAGQDGLVLSVGAATGPLLFDALGPVSLAGAVQQVSGFEHYSVRGTVFDDALHGGEGDDRLEDVLYDGGNDLLDGRGGDDGLFGGWGQDTLWGGEGQDHLVGGGGADRLNGGAGRDLMLGGGGADVFVFTAASQSGTGLWADLIMDFGRFGSADVINLSAIDATASTAWNAPFNFIGTDVFTAEGQLRLAVVEGQTVIQANTSGLDAAEMEILLGPLSKALDQITASDFIL